MEALFSEALRLNMRLIAGKVMMDRHVPDYLCETAGESYRQTRALIRRWHPARQAGLCHHPALCPTSTPGLLEAVQRLRAGVSRHLAAERISVKNREEIAWVKQLWPEHARYLDVYHHYQLTGERSVFAHGIHLDDAEVAVPA
ncbi:amidohydrolase family protein [Klebsiella pneumoniae subsp. pneumoniae]|nr:amidohydrolase family protein [Klebsiella pneumoniae subsp. pneumoniae]